MTEGLSVPHAILNQMRKSDRLARWLFRQGLRPPQLALFIFIYALVYSFLLSLLYGELQQALNDWTTLVILVVVLPLIAYYYFWQMQGIQTLFDSLTSPIMDKKLRQKASLPFAHLFGGAFWFWLSITIGVVQSVYIFYDTFYQRVGWQSHFWMVVTLVPLRFVAFYCLIYVLSRQVIATISVNQLLDIYPRDAVLSFDKDSGLFQLGYHVLSIGFIAGLVGLILGLTLLRVHQGLENYSIEFVLDLVLYIIAAPTLFLLPLWKAHLLMAGTRDQLLREIEREEGAQYVLSLVKMRSKKLTGPDGERLEALERLRQKTRNLPTWPLNVGIISQFSAAVILPVVVPIGLNILTNFIQDLILRFSN